MYKQFFVPIIISFVISAAMGPLLIPFLQRLKAGQTVRDDGPQSHLAKNGTPTMGGFIFLIGYVVTCLAGIAMGQDAKRIMTMLVGVLGFAAIGFIDDYIKVVLKRSMGLRAWQKFGLQIILGIGIIFFAEKELSIAMNLLIPFTGITLNLGILTYPALLFVMLGTVNGANFTDGLDGLATQVTAVIACFFMVAAIIMGKGGWFESAAMLGGLLGFLLYNSHKASVFMGDTGSLALGGYVSVIAIILNMPIFIVLVAFIYLAEVCSVIIQVGYFKISGGKRVFKMAPIHHHFELCGYKETKVVAAFTIVTFILCALSILGI